MKPGTKALAAGAAAGCAMTVCYLLARLAFFDGDDIRMALYLGGGLNGLLGGAAIVAITHLPLRWRPSRRAGWIAAGVVFLAAVSGMPVVDTVALPATIGYALGIFTAELVPESAKMLRRLAVALGSTGALLVGAVLSAVVVGSIAGETSDAVSHALLSSIFALFMMNITLKVTLRRQARADRAAGADRVVVFPAPRSAPRGWMWAKLHDRKLGVYALGYRYDDPMAGACFHILADLRSRPSAESLRRAGYRGEATVRLAAHETLYVDGAPPHVLAQQQATFDQGGVLGTALMALTRQECNALALPDAPPWAAIYARQAA